MFTPYGYQKGCLVVLKTTRIQGKKTALMVMASGLGKTVTVAFDAKEWLKEHGGRILYLCHQNDILGQARQTFEAILGAGYTYGYFTGREKTAHKADCLFASFQTMSKHTERTFFPDEFGYIIVDESHHSQAPSHLKTVEYFKPKFLLGATATPDRADGLNIRRVFGDEVFNLPLEKALAQGLLTKVDYRLVTDEISFDQIKSANIDRMSLKDIDHTVFVRIQKRDEEISASIDKHASEFAEQRIVIFASTVARAEQLAQRIPGSAPYHSELPTNERLIRLEMFRQGLLRAVVTVDCFNEGIDIPEANIIVFLRSTASQRIFYQQLGRGLRLSQGKEKVIVLDFVGNAERITMLKELADSIGVHYSEEMATRANKPHPFKIKFDEKAQGVLDLVKRIRVKRLVDVPEFLREYSSRNLHSASHVSIKSWKDVWWMCGRCGYEWQTSPAARGYGSRQCPKCEEQVTDKNNLAVLYPNLARQYSSKNPLPANQIKARTREMMWWKCPKCSYEYAARPYCRIYRHDGCPACAAKMPAYLDNLAFNSPKLMLEYADTNMLSPEHVGLRTTFGRWWICSDCGSSYQASARARDDGKGCPKCTAKVPTKVVNLITTHPFLADEYSSRNRKPADTILADTEDQLWWVCSSCGRYWQASGSERLNGKRCPNCQTSVTVPVE